MAKFERHLPSRASYETDIEAPDRTAALLLAERMADQMGGGADPREEWSVELVTTVGHEDAPMPANDLSERDERHTLSLTAAAWAALLRAAEAGMATTKDHDALGAYLAVKAHVARLDATGALARGDESIL